MRLVTCARGNGNATKKKRSLRTCPNAKLKRKLSITKASESQTSPMMFADMRIVLRFGLDL
jgi:hypothetical protein